MNIESRVTVILVSYYGDRWVKKSIDTLHLASIHPSRLIVVDNAGNSCIEDLDLSDFNSKILRCNTPLGFAEANNFALLNGGLENEFVCFLNQDTLSGKGWLDACLECINKNGKVGALTPLVATYDWKGLEPNFLECAYLSKEFRTDWDKKKRLKEWYSVPRIPAVAMIARTDVIRKVGPFDPIYGSYYEDYDLCARIRNAGYKLAVCTEGRIAHYSGSATNDCGKEKKRFRQIIRNGAIMNIRYSKYRLSNYFSHFFVSFPRRIVRSVLKRPGTQPIDTVLKAWGDILTITPRLISARVDKNAWNSYLSNINWPSHSKIFLKSYKKE